MTAQRLGNLTIRTDAETRARLEAYVETMRDLFGVRLTIAGAARAALERGLDGLEADIAKASKR